MLNVHPPKPNSKPTQTLNPWMNWVRSYTTMLKLKWNLDCKKYFQTIYRILLHIHTHTQDILGKITKYFNIANFYILWPITICSYFVLFCKYTKKYAYVVYIFKNLKILSSILIYLCFKKCMHQLTHSIKQ